MLHGASIRVSPNWTPGITTTIDFEWDDTTLSDSRPTGRWFGDLALLGGTGSNEGEWEWDPMTQELELWVRLPGNLGARRLIAVLKPFPIPVTTGTTGTGKLSPGLAPTIEAPEFGWETFAPDFLAAQRV